MIRKYQSHKPQTNPWHCEEEPHNHHETPVCSIVKTITPRYRGRPGALLHEAEDDI